MVGKAWGGRGGLAAAWRPRRRAAKPDDARPTPDRVLAFQIGWSPETQHTITPARRRNVPVGLHRCPEHTPALDGPAAAHHTVRT